MSGEILLDELSVEVEVEASASVLEEEVGEVYI